ncbi:uncharacterized protein [Linepithema humile]|uniref:uncharacterized protein n=1 Tax=Linepithema humile TaxID=83485 RepID=UPI0006238C70|nr:PREDICTED: uncharacterized protein LOC105679243 [Linepithema humile]
MIGAHRTRTTAYHPQYNGMIERWHQSLKAAIMCHAQPPGNWTEILPTVLLGLRTSLKEGINASTAEMVYGKTLRIPGKFFIGKEPSIEPQIFLEKHRLHMRKIRSAPKAHHNKAKSFVHKNLHTCTHVFVKTEGKKFLEPPYKGPYKIIKQISERIFKFDINGEQKTVTTERVKPAFLKNDVSEQQSSTPSTLDSASRSILKTYPSAKDKTTTKKSVQFAL